MHVPQGGKQNWTRAECDAFNSIHFGVKLGSGIRPARTGKVCKLKCACPHIHSILCCLHQPPSTGLYPFWLRHVLACLMSAWVCLYVTCLREYDVETRRLCLHKVSDTAVKTRYLQIYRKKRYSQHWGASYGTKTCMATRCVIIPCLLSCSFQGTGKGTFICH